MKAIPLAPFDDSASEWTRTIYAFLAEKERRSESRRTVECYSRMLYHFFARLGKTPDQVTGPDVFAFAHGIGLSGREPSATTVGVRIACLSSFYRFLIRMEVMTADPCDRLERPKTSPSPPRGLGANEIKRLLAAIPESPVGLRDRAIVLTLTLTGRRRSEVLSLKAGNIMLGDPVYYTYRRKDGKQGKRELPRPAFDAIIAALAAFDRELSGMHPDESLWPSRQYPDRGITSGTFYGNLRRYLRRAGLAPAGVHILRHSAAKLRRDAGETIEDVSRFLDHSALAVTTVYLRRLEGEQDRSWEHVAVALGL